MFTAIFAGVKEIQSPVHVPMKRRSRLCASITRTISTGVGAKRFRSGSILKPSVTWRLMGWLRGLQRMLFLRVHLVILHFLTHSYLRNLVYIVSQYIRYSLATVEDAYGI